MLYSLLIDTQRKDSAFQHSSCMLLKIILPPKSQQRPFLPLSLALSTEICFFINPFGSDMSTIRLSRQLIGSETDKIVALLSSEKGSESFGAVLSNVRGEPLSGCAWKSFLLI